MEVYAMLSKQFTVQRSKPVSCLTINDNSVNE